jgi:hypothetical protein
VGNKPTLESEILREGTYSIAFTATLNKVTGYDGTIPNSGDLSGLHIRAWYASIAFPNMDSYANGGLRFYLSDGTNTAYWNLAGKDTYQGGWINALIYADSTPDSGSVNTSAVTELGFERTDLTSPKNLVNTWVDYFRAGAGLVATGGSSADPITLEGIYQDDLANGYGIVDKINGVYFLYGSLQIGDGATATYFESVGEVVVFADAVVNAGLYGLTFTGSGCEAVLDGTVIRAAGTGDNTRFSIDASDTGLAGFTLANSTLVRGADLVFANGQTITGNRFDDCGQISPSSSTFESNTVSGYQGTDGALLWPGGTTVNACSFASNTRAIEIDTGTSHTFDALTFTGNTYDIHNSSASAVTVNATNGSNPATFINTGGGSVTIQNTKLLTLTDLPNGVEVRLRQGSVSLDHVQNVTGNQYQYSYPYAGDERVTISAGGSGYERREMSYVLTANNATIPFELNPSPSYV